MDLSVVIPTWNNIDRLASSLDALHRCSVPDGIEWEIVLVDNNCTDGTVHLAERFARLLPLKYVREPRQGLSYARNAGVLKATGMLVIFADDDMSPSQAWIQEYWGAYQAKGDGFYYGGPIESEFETGDFDRRMLSAAPHGSMVGVDFGAHARQLAPTERLQSNWACAARALRSAGGFDVTLGLDATQKKHRLGEEFELMHRLELASMKAWYLPGARVVHFVPAKKCTVRHLGARSEGHGSAALLDSTRAYPARYPYVAPFMRDGEPLSAWAEAPGPRLLGVHWRLHAVMASLIARMVLKRLGGRPRYAEYFALRFGCGLIRALQETRRR